VTLQHSKAAAAAAAAAAACFAAKMTIYQISLLQSALDKLQGTKPAFRHSGLVL
jgi:hypothetical protein